MAKTTGLNSGFKSGIQGNDEHVCGKCRAEFGKLEDFLTHKRICSRKRPVILVSDETYEELCLAKTLSIPRLTPYQHFSEENEIVQTDDKPESSESEDLPSLVTRRNSTFGEEFPVEDCAVAPNLICKRNIKTNTSFLSPLPQLPLGQLSDTNVTLEALENTRVAVAQHGADSQLSHIAALHSALYALQQQQLLQIEVIQQLQTQLMGSSQTSTPVTTAPLTGSAALTPPQSGENTTATVSTTTSIVASTSRTTGLTTTTTSANSKTSDNSTDVKHTLAPPPPLPHEPNTLELLQRHTEQALQNTMSGGSFLLNGLSGLNSSTDVLRYCKGKDPEKREGTDEAFFRHRCRFCGKLFGSDSALQIHIRSHTGERPFKCNVCGNRFSTKGNLKVHFQRHTSKYPHIKMNPNPVPEHLDSLHPPLEPPEERSGKDSEYDGTQPNLSTSVSAPQSELEYKVGNGSPDEITSQDLGSPVPTRSLSPNEASNLSDASDITGDNSAIEDNLDKDSEFLKGEDEDQRSFTSTPKVNDGRKDDDLRSDEEGRLLSETDNNDIPQSLIPAFIHTSTPTFPSFLNPTSFSPICFPTVPTTPTVTTTVPGANNDNMGIHADPAFYQNLLPKPGSNDNSWESLMEITKTSETHKLQQLVDNIEHKLSDPNQCVICHRVLSCKSALQMHYRTHTGERPFKCKICGRAFTTKGNLKTHMGVHRVKPPLRVLHQCPVCHKQFTNSLVLQQHIRTHTGEPTDMLPEHIMANEIKTQSLLQASFPRPMMPSISQHLSSPVSMAAPIPMLSNMQSNKGMDAQKQDDSPSPLMANDSVIKTTSCGKENKSEDSESSNGETPPVTGTEETPPITSVMPALTRSISPASDRVITTPDRVIPTPDRVISTPDRVISTPDRIITTSSNFHIPYTASLVALENHVKAINSNIPQSLPFSPFGLGLHMGNFLRYDDPSNFVNRTLSKEGSRDKSPPPANTYSSSPSTSRAGSEESGDERSTPGSPTKIDSPSSINPVQPTVSSSCQSENGALDLTPRTSILSKSISSTADIAMFSPLSGLPFPPPGNRPNTTCKVCFKTFACNSALEIHYRSHTKERPFKCTVCDRGFSTKGNMKQHMLTHKIRDLPSQLFSTDDSNSSVTSTQTLSALTNTVTDSGTSPRKEMTPPKEIPPQTSPAPPTPSPSPKRPLSEGNTILAVSKKPPPTGMPKHMCLICNKPFSSASALQIHMRTHTGDKPFKCSICGRAFTTKGNLKVHMGTHMWNNCSSRRGRRMSLELPGLPISPGKPGDLPPPRHDLYFPYLPPSYVNGMTTPKMNEISVIQTAGVTNGNVVSSLNMSPAVSIAGEDQSKTDHESRKSPVTRASDISSSHCQESPPATWSWKIACNICNKICCSSTELEIHVQCHYQTEGAKDDGKCVSNERIST